MRQRLGARFAIATALLLVVPACSGTKVDTAAPGGTTAPSGNSTPSACTGTTLTSPEKGVTPTTITITTIADTGSPIRPGLFRGSISAVKAWADAVNDSGGLACRKVVVKTADSKLSPEDAKNAVAAACGSSLALVGTSALFLQDVRGLEQCADRAGTATGLPDLAVLQTEPAQQCSPVSFPSLPFGASCPYSGTGPRTYRQSQVVFDYYLAKFGKDALHGVFVIPKDLPSTIAAFMPYVRAANQKGITSDREFGKSGLDTQVAFTEVATTIKANGSTYAANALDYKGTVLMRKEARAQGVASVKVWDCPVACYDTRLITEAQGATEGQYLSLQFLPVEDGSAQPALAQLLQYDKEADAFGIQAWVAGEIFARAVNDTMKAHGNDPNSITRANLLTAVRNLHDFDAGGLIPKTDIGAKVPSTCWLVMQVQGGKFVRVDPVAPGTFDCNGNKPPLDVTIDPAKEYRG